MSCISCSFGWIIPFVSFGTNSVTICTHCQSLMFSITANATWETLDKDHDYQAWQYLRDHALCKKRAAAWNRELREFTRKETFTKKKR